MIVLSTTPTDLCQMVEEYVVCLHSTSCADCCVWSTMRSMAPMSPCYHNAFLISSLAQVLEGKLFLAGFGVAIVLTSFAA